MGRYVIEFRVDGSIYAEVEAKSMVAAECAAEKIREEIADTINCEAADDTDLYIDVRGVSTTEWE